MEEEATTHIDELLDILTNTVGAEAPYILTNMRKMLKLLSNTSSCTKNEYF